MNRNALIMGIAAVFVSIAALMVMVGLVVNPFFLLVAVPFGGSAYLLWYQASGKLAAKIHQQAANGQFNAAGRQQTASGGFEAEADGSGFTARQRARRARQTQQRRRRSTQQTQQNRRQRQTVDAELSRAEARTVLGVEPSASQADIKRAYRQQAKQHHPDSEGGDEETFKTVSHAYETLSE